MRLQVLSGALICNDAKSCFDRVVHAAAMFAMARLGLSYNVLSTLFLTLQMAEHRVKTAFGVSKRTYGGTKRKLGTLPMHGVGQGNGIAPACWVAISSILINMMQEVGYGAYFTTALTLGTLFVVCFSFIDDTDLFYTAPTPDTPGEECIPAIQKTLDKWGGVLRATGGALVPGKSLWWLIDFKYKAAKLIWEPRDKADMPGDITMANIENTGREILKRLEPHQPEVMLGINLAPSSQEDGVIAHIEEKIDDFVTPMKAGRLDRNDSWLAFTSRILPALRYMMPVITLSMKQWNKLI